MASLLPGIWVMFSQPSSDLFCPVSLQQSKGSGESRGEVSNLHGLDVVDGLGELGDVLVGGLHQLCLSFTVSETVHQRFRLIGESEDGDEVVLPQRVHDIDHHVLGNLLPQPGH